MKSSPEPPPEAVGRDNEIHGGCIRSNTTMVKGIIRRMGISNLANTMEHKKVAFQ